jgi:hypothetical protein
MEEIFLLRDPVFHFLRNRARSTTHLNVNATLSYKTFTGFFKCP